MAQTQIVITGKSPNKDLSYGASASIVIFVLLLFFAWWITSPCRYRVNNANSLEEDYIPLAKSTMTDNYHKKVDLALLGVKKNPRRDIFKYNLKTGGSHIAMPEGTISTNKFSDPNSKETQSAVSPKIKKNNAGSLNNAENYSDGKKYSETIIWIKKDSKKILVENSISAPNDSITLKVPPNLNSAMSANIIKINCLSAQSGYAYSNDINSNYFLN